MASKGVIWDAVLVELVDSDGFRIKDLDFEPEERHSVRRALKEMEDLGWLYRETTRSATFRSGEKFEQL